MKKGLIFIGIENTGKSMVAKTITDYYENKAIYLDGRQFHPDNKFFFHNCTLETKVIIIDEIPISFDFNQLYSIASGKITVNERFQKPFEIEIDKLIIILHSGYNLNNIPTSESFLRRFTILKFPNPSLDIIIHELTREKQYALEIEKANLLKALHFLNTSSDILN